VLWGAFLGLGEEGWHDMSSVVEQAIAEGRDELTDAESRQYLESEVQRYLGIDLDEFMTRADAGTLPEHPAVAHLILLTGARPSSC
jgi:hypothetical protein